MKKKYMKKKYPKFMFIYIIIISFFVFTGYAYVNSDLQINAEVLAKRTSLGIEIKNIRVSEDSTFKTQSNFLDDSVLYYQVKFNQMNQKYIIKFDLCNTGTLDVKLKDYSYISSSIFSYELYYENNDFVLFDDVIKSGETKKMILEIFLRDGISSDTLIDEDSINYDLDMEFEIVKNTTSKLYLYKEDKQTKIINYKEIEENISIGEITEKTISCVNATPIEIDNNIYLKDIEGIPYCTMLDNVFSAEYYLKLISEDNPGFYSENSDGKNHILMLDDVYMNNETFIYSTVDLNGHNIVAENDFNVHNSNITSSKPNAKIIINDGKINGGDYYGSYNYFDNISIERVGSTTNSLFYVRNYNYNYSWYVSNCNINLNYGSLTSEYNVSLKNSNIISKNTDILINGDNERYNYLYIIDSTINTDGYVFNSNIETSIKICNSNINSGKAEFKQILGNVIYSDNTTFTNQDPRVESNTFEYGLLRDNYVCN